MLLRTGLLLVAWSIPAVLHVAMEVLSERRAGHFLAPWRLFIAAALPWYVWVPFTPLVMRLVRRRPLRRPVTVDSVWPHLALCAVITVLFVLAMRTARDAMGLAVGDDSLWTIAVAWSLLTVPTYAAVLGISHAVLYARRARDEALERALLAEQLTRAQLDALRVQLHPHFLFNALNTIAMLVRDRDADTAVRLIAELADILRELLRDQGETEVPLRAELDLVRRCLAIEQVRFGDRLTVDWLVHDEVLDALVPPLILQPIVENAIRHGIAHRTAPGTIRIEAAARGETLVLTVLDDGPIGPARSGPRVAALGGAGLGLANTRARMERMYGDRAYVRLARTDGCLTQATIVLPLVLRPAALPPDDADGRAPSSATRGDAPSPAVAAAPRGSVP